MHILLCFVVFGVVTCCCSFVCNSTRLAVDLTVFYFSFFLTLVLMFGCFSK